MASTRSQSPAPTNSAHIPMTTQPPSLEALRAQLRAFVAERDWDQFHNPKNLAMAVVVEAAELVEQFQWLTLEQSEQLPPETRTAVEMEVADVLLFLLRLCDRLEIDPLQVAQRKLALNARKYPVDKARGRATKYDKL
jgi:NTP pyrophosphatase (non-canonical NTP hydrolase)